MTAPKFPPRVWVEHKDLETSPSFVIADRNASGLDDQVEYISAPEMLALLAEKDAQIDELQNAIACLRSGGKLLTQDEYAEQLREERAIGDEVLRELKKIVLHIRALAPDEPSLNTTAAEAAIVKAQKALRGEK